MLNPKYSKEKWAFAAKEQEQGGGQWMENYEEEASKGGLPAERRIG